MTNIMNLIAIVAAFAIALVAALGLAAFAGILALTVSVIVADILLSVVCAWIGISNTEQ